MGITRLGNITGLDRIGIPVAIAVRPNSRSVSVAQGKGLDMPQAMASALMEACETFHAEEIGQLRVAAYRHFKRREKVVDPATLCAGTHEFDPAAPIAWVQGYDLVEREPCWVPAEIVHTDYTLPQPDGYFLAGSNGLASGNHLIEAVNAALYELVERDAVAVWISQPLKQRASRVLDLASVDDPDCRALLALYETAGITCARLERDDRYRLSPLSCAKSAMSRRAIRSDRRRFHGSGCHADRVDCVGPRPDRGGADTADVYRRHSRRPLARGI